MYPNGEEKNGVSALELSRHLGISYDAAWRVKHKLIKLRDNTGTKQ
jgi:hypothetical protein